MVQIKGNFVQFSETLFSFILLRSRLRPQPYCTDFECNVLKTGQQASQFEKLTPKCLVLGSCYGMPLDYRSQAKNQSVKNGNADQLNLGLFHVKSPVISNLLKKTLLVLD